jgi:hypothetical protein
MNFKEVLSDVYPIIEKYAPTLATALGSPLSGMAAVFGANIIANAFGVNVNDVKRLPEIIGSDLDAKEKLCSLEETFSSFFQNASNNFKMPNHLEVTVKASWLN